MSARMGCLNASWTIHPSLSIATTGSSRPIKIKERVYACREWRERQKITGDAYKLRNTPALMRQNRRFREESFVVMPRVSGERRRYIPFGYVEKGSIPGDSIMLAIGANYYHFGVICSNVHMAWTRVVCGRLKGDYRYSSDIVYNNFPWPSPNAEQKDRIEKTAKGIIEARELYKDCSYDKYPYGKPQTDEVARGSGNREYGCRRLREKLPNFSGVSFF